MEKTAIYKIDMVNGEKLIELRENTYEALNEAVEWAKENIKLEEDSRTYFQICTVIAEKKEDAIDYENTDIDFIHYEIYKDKVLKNEYGQMVEA